MRWGLRYVLMCALTLGVANASSAALVGYYPFNGNGNEASGNNIDLSLVGDAGFGASVHAGLGSALSLDGDGDGAIGSNFVKFSAGSSMTGMAWVYANSLDGDWNTIMKNWGTNVGGQFHFGLGNTVANTLQNHVTGIATATDDADFLVNQWVHTAFVFDAMAAQHRLYINGQPAILPVDTGAGVLGLGDATGLGVGHKPNDDGTALSDNGPGPWNGFIDEVALFDEALTETQILAIYQNGLNGIQLDGTSVPEPSGLFGAIFLALGLGGYSAVRRTRSRSNPQF